MPQVAAPFDRKAVETALQAWLEEATGVTIAIANQDMPQPPHPYGTLALSATRSIGQDEVNESFPDDGAPAGSEIKIAVSGQRILTCSVNFYTSTKGEDAASSDARTLIDQARASLGLPSVLSTLRAAGIAYSSSTGPQSLDEINSDKYVARTQADFFFCVASNVSERTGYIETIATTSDAPIGPSTFTTVGP